MTKWLEYFVEGVAVSMAKIKRRILRFSVDRKITKEKGQVYLNERQLKGLEYIQRNGRITNSEYVSLNRVSRNTSSRDLMEMVEFKVIAQKGVGRGSYFEKM